MPKTTKDPARERTLRRKAETLLSGCGQSPPPAAPEPDPNRLLHELRVHQVELEMQNEELRRNRDEHEFLLSQYTDLYDFSPVSYFSLDGRGTIRRVNLAGADLLATPRSSLLQSNFASFVSPGDQAAWAGFLERILEAKAKLSHEFSLDITPGRVHVLAEGSRDGGGCRLALMDVTERRKATEQLVVLKERAEAANKSKSMFLAMMSHEIRTPLNGVLGMLQLLQLTSLDTEQDEYTRLATVSSQRLLRLLSDILDLSKVESGKLELSACEFSLAEVRGSVMDIFGFLGKQKGLEVGFALDARLPSDLVGDAARLRQILLNLASNAVKFTDSGSVRLDASAASDPGVSPVRVAFTVSDTGRGISQDQQGRIFEPFIQVDGSSTRDQGGAGLGLAIVKRLTDLMGGEIGVKSVPGQGTTMRLTLPFALVAQPTDAVIAAPAPEAAVRKLRVLLAEDDQISQTAIRLMLEKAGHKATVAQNGREALSLLAAGNFDLILMDIQMPVLDGLEAIRAIREGKAQGENPGIPIIAMTAYAMTGDREKFLAAGMDGYIAKPVVLEALIDIVEKTAWTHGRGDRRP
jgi:signal transduction histidine kinase/CheY-like chemotaxis protein